MNYRSLIFCYMLLLHPSNIQGLKKGDVTKRDQSEAEKECAKFWCEWDGKSWQEYQGEILCNACSCFPATAKVTLENGKFVTMSELQIGDKVQTGSSKGGVKYSAVRALMKKQYSVTTVYKILATSSIYTITLSGTHLIHARKSDNEMFKTVYADQIFIGDEILTQHNFKLIPTMVTAVSTFTMQGGYTPVTMDENIIVNGILASCYAIADHHLAHIVMTPIRWFPEIMNFILGEDNCILAYADIAEELGTWV